MYYIIRVTDSKPRYGPFSLSLIASLLLKELPFNSYLPVVLSGLKNAQCSNGGTTEMMPTKDVFFNYLNTHPKDKVFSDNLQECLSKCQQNCSECSIILNDGGCTMHDLSPSQSYGISKKIEESKVAFIKLCPPGIHMINF